MSINPGSLRPTQLSEAMIVVIIPEEIVTVADRAKWAADNHDHLPLLQTEETEVEAVQGIEEDSNISTIHLTHWKYVTI